MSELLPVIDFDFANVGMYFQALWRYVTGDTRNGENYHCYHTPKVVSIECRLLEPVTTKVKIYRWKPESLELNCDLVREYIKKQTGEKEINVNAIRIEYFHRRKRYLLYEHGLKYVGLPRSRQPINTIPAKIEAIWDGHRYNLFEELTPVWNYYWDNSLLPEKNYPLQEAMAAEALRHLTGITGDTRQSLAKICEEKNIHLHMNLL